MIHFPPLCASDGVLFCRLPRWVAVLQWNLKVPKAALTTYRNLQGLQLDYLFLTETEELQSGYERINLLWTTTSISGMW